MSTLEQTSKTEIPSDNFNEFVSMSVYGHKCEVLGFVEYAAAFRARAIQARLGLEAEPALPGTPEAVVAAQERFVTFKKDRLAATDYEKPNKNRAQQVELFSGKAEEGAEEAVEVLLGVNDVASSVSGPDGPPVRKGDMTTVCYSSTTPDGITLTKALQINYDNGRQVGRTVKLFATAKN